MTADRWQDIRAVQVQTGILQTVRIHPQTAVIQVIHQTIHQTEVIRLMEVIIPMDQTVMMMEAPMTEVTTMEVTTMEVMMTAAMTTEVTTMEAPMTAVMKTIAMTVGTDRTAADRLFRTAI